VKGDGSCHTSKTLFHFTVVALRLSAISMGSYIILLPTVIRKQVIHHLIKGSELCDVVKSDIDGSLIKAAHVHPWKGCDNLVYETKPRHNTYVQSNIIHFHAVCSVGLLSSNFAARNTCLQVIVFISGVLMNKGGVAIISKDSYLDCIQFEFRLLYA
jgi:hypothetical protein